MKKNEQKGKKGKGIVLNWNNKSVVYGTLTAGVAVFVTAIVLIVLAATGVFSEKKPTVDLSGGVQSGLPSEDEEAGGKNDKDDVPTNVAVAYINPIDGMTLLHEHGFFYNKTLDCYYEHVGIDVSAEEGAEVYAIASGTVESITAGDEFNGAQVVIDHGKGVKSSYTFVKAADELKVGSYVTQGQVVAKVAAPVGNEYKDGAHLHLEMTVNGEYADPADYLTLGEK